MKILIADDQTRRYGRLVEALAALDIEREQIDIVPCAQAARDKLADNFYDLFVLDILIPLWPEGDPEERQSFDLLVELHETGDYQQPGHIIGITADPDQSGEIARRFAEQAWTVVPFSESSDEWVTRICNCLRYILDRAAAERAIEYGVDLAIVCALPKPEIEEVLKLPWAWSQPEPIDEQTFIHRGRLISNGKTFSVVAAAPARMGMVSTALLASKLISILRPRVITMCGICAGIEEKVRIGDVLFADPAWDWQSGKRTRDNENTQFTISPHQLAASPIVRAHMTEVAADRTALAQIVTQYGTDAEGMLRVYLGPVASGSAVLADGEVVNEIRAQHRELIGIEMEIYGLYAAAQTSSSPAPQAFALKGVCDYAKHGKDDKYQRYAAYASANVLRLLIERFGHRLFA